MDKVQMGPQTLVYPMPAILVGSNVDGNPNFMTVAWGGIANGDPPMLSLAIRHQRHTLKGIRQNGTFSANIPSTDQVKEADYCGIVSGAKANKAEKCRFQVFYGTLGTAPLIAQCPVNLECRALHFLDLGSHTLVIGKIEETYVSATCMTNGKPDVAKIRPLTYVPGPATRYQALGEVMGKAFNIGKDLT